MFQLEMAKFINFKSNIKHLPKRIILIRHGQSSANLDRNVYANTPDHKIPLTPHGIDQAREAGRKLLDLANNISDHGNPPNCSSNAYFYVSPYERAKSTLREIIRAFPRHRVVGVREECRLREKDYGCFQHKSESVDPMAGWDKIEEDCEKYGRFFYRFPNGESGADVYNSVSSFVETLWRDIDMKRLYNDPSSVELNVVIVSHEETILIFLMRWFHWSTEQFESLKGPKNCEIRVLELGSSGEYSLAVQHDDETMKEWGLSDEMIEDQNQRAIAKPREYVSNEKNPRYLNSFFDSIDTDDGSHQQDADQNN
ncbi:OLC1v1000564C1 [Oldenlandia corymbosa var. corymbosa]|uniref:OLC1v1000564C1 n=1 Tax=Oldenlandia corymbosa var. corymbosa TaxID=529605 RepID=A0AAV1D673_OLDCO|nr:OLC1v1000564C1 [Oldenlandia corymbosa var. corymbosa]